MKKCLRLLLFVAGIPLIAMLLIKPEKEEADSDLQENEASNLPFMVMVYEDKGTFGYEPEEMVCHMTAALTSEDLLLELEGSENKQQEYLKALAVVCRSNLVYTWRQKHCPKQLDIKKSGLAFRKLKSGSAIDIWIREAVEATKGAVITDVNSEEKTVIAAPFFTSSDWEITIGEVGEGVGISLNYALLLAKEGYDFKAILKYFFQNIRIIIL